MQRRIPPPVPPAVPPRIEPVVRPHDGPAELGPVVVITKRRPTKRRSGGGAAAAMSLLLAVSAVAGGFLAWPHLQKSRLRAKKPAPKAAAPVTVAKAESPRAKNSERLEREDPPAEVQEQAARGVHQGAVPAEQREQEPMRQQAGTEREQSAAARDATEPLLPGSRTARVADDVERRIVDAARVFRSHDFEAASEALDEAEKGAGDDADQATRIERWRLLLDYARQLDDHVAKAIAAANQGREYTIGDRTIVIIEIGPKTYAYKESGVIKRGPRAGLPRVVERAILKAWYDGDPRPANGIFLGVHHLLDDDVDLGRVRAAWQQALVGEPATASIMPLLDDRAIATRP